MTPFPHEAAERIMWVDSMSRRRGNRMRLLNRLSMEGRHYICPQHFHVNALRYIPGLGIFKKAFFLPIHDPNEQVVTRVPEPQEDDYIPLLIYGIDNEKVQWVLDYDKVTSIVGEIEDEIHQEIGDERFLMTSSYSGLNHLQLQDREEKCHSEVVGREDYGCEQASGEPEETDADVQTPSRAFLRPNLPSYDAVSSFTSMRMLTPEMLSRATLASITDSSGMAFTFAAFAYLIALIAVAFCIFFAIYTVICIDELKTDYKNPIEQCRNLNQLILPEYVIHIIYTFLFLLSWQLFGILMNLPLALYHIA
ncbi:hypothetical protein GCK32_013574, partial [Trichostrongylus colubriformis]